jgi:antitoxin YefM
MCRFWFRRGLTARTEAVENCTERLYNRPMIHSSYTEARANFAKLMDKVIDDADIVIIERRGHERVAMISAEQLERMQETLYVLNSPENARRIREGIEEGKQGRIKAQTAQEIRSEFGLSE